MSWVHVSCKLQWAVNWVPLHLNMSCSCELGLSITPSSLSCAARHLSRQLSWALWAAIIFILLKKNKPHFIILQNVDFVNRVLRAGIKKGRQLSSNLPLFYYAAAEHMFSYMSCQLSWQVNAGLEIIRGAALLLYLLKETILE